MFGHNFPFMLLVGFIAVVPTLAIMALPEESVMSLIPMFLSLIFALIVQGVVVFAVFQHLTGSVVTFGESFNVALRRLGYLILVSIATGFLTSIGYLLLIVPGIIISLMLWVAIPVTIVEKNGVGYALARSKELTEGYRMQILGIVVIVGILTLIASGIQAGLTAVLTNMGMAPGALNVLLISVPIHVITTGLASALGSVVATVGYYALRQEVDGVATEDLASVFA